MIAKLVIDKHALVSIKAKLGKNVYVGPFSVIGPDVEIGDGTWIDSHVVIQGKAKIGQNNKIFHFASIGAPPQHLKYANEPTAVEIGDNNIIREYCSIHRGTAQGHNVTKIGDRNYIMAYVHIAHDCSIGNENIFANNVALAGHVTIENFVGLGGYAKVLQFSFIGSYSFITGSTDVYKDVPPYVLVASQHGEFKTYGLNLVGLKRYGFSPGAIRNLKRAYSIIYRQHLTSKEAIAALEAMVVVCPEVKGFIDILRKSKRGIVR